MGSEMIRPEGTGQLDVSSAECGLSVLLEACDRAVEDVGPNVPPVQMRALLVVDQANGLNLNRLARALAASASAVSRLCDRMQESGLITRKTATASRREIIVVPTESGRKLASWIRQRRQAAISRLFDQMSSDGRQALARGLGELAAAGLSPS
jgi:DNA-binding MarR family transcriptional regulator